jgi:hypothetical protein
MFHGLEAAAGDLSPPPEEEALAEMLTLLTEDLLKPLAMLLQSNTPLGTFRTIFRGSRYSEEEKTF